MSCTGLKASGILNSGCVIPHCVFSSVYSSKRRQATSESRPVIIHSRDTNAKRARENTRGARPLCQGLQPVQLRVLGASLLNMNTRINLPRSAPAEAKGSRFYNSFFWVNVGVILQAQLIETSK